ncbi:MAG TPA: PAS domain-containing protein [Dehalococcoidia bacterium]|nr:PAS domain-containing protein [Dehalococcoidia bacterium]
MSIDLPATGAHGRATAAPEATGADAGGRDYFAVAALAGCIVWIGDAQGRIVEVSPNASEITGYPPAQWAARPDAIERYVHVADRPRVLPARADALAGGDAFELEYRLVAADGNELWLRERARRGADGRWVGAIVDLTALRQRERRLELKDHVAEILAYADTLEDAAVPLLRLVCEMLSWQWGALWLVDADEAQIRCISTYSSNPEAQADLDHESRARPFARGTGLPGRVWESGKAAWIADVGTDDNAPRAPYVLALGLRSAFAAPIIIAGKTIGVMEFFSRDLREPDDALLVMMANVGRQMGQFAERKIVEAQLRESEERYRTLFEALPAMVATRSARGGLTYVNRRWTEYTGLPWEELKGNGLIKRAVHPEDAPRIIAAWEQSRETGEPIEIDYRVRRRDGLYRWHLWRALPLRDASGRIVEWLGTTTNIDDRKAGEVQQEFLADATALLASSLDYVATLGKLAELAVPRIADACTVDLFDEERGVTRVRTVATRPEVTDLLERMHARNWVLDQRSGMRVSDALSAGRPVFVEDVRAALRAASGLTPAERADADALGARSAIMVPLRARNRTVGVLAFLSLDAGREYTQSDLGLAEELARRAGIAVDNARLYEEAQAIADELRRANKVKDEFLGLVSHELRTPITTIFGNAQVLRSRGERLDAAVRQQALRDIEQEAERLHRIIDNMLVLARIESGRPLETEPLLLHRLIAHVASRHRERHPGRTVRLDVPAVLPPVIGEPTYFEQVLGNLLNNAEKYSPAEQPIDVQARHEGDQVFVAVRDRGSGIAPEDAEQIFETFYRARSTAGKVSGAGIGLAVCKRLVEAQGGTISARPRDGGGAEFTFSLRVEQDGEWAGE